MWELFRRGKVEGPSVPRLLAWGSRRQAKEKQGILCGLLGEHIFSSLIGPKVEAGTNLTEAVGY